MKVVFFVVLRTPTTNPYGKDPADVAETLEYLDTV